MAAPEFFHQMARFNKYFGEDFLGGPRVLKQAWVINAQKATTALFVFGLMILSDNFSTPAWIYLALHGTYGLVWLMKHLALPDSKWDVRITFGAAFMDFALVLGLYWVAPVLLITDVLGPDRALPSIAMMAGAVALHTLGIVIMMVADAQKYFTLKLQRGLIQSGVFARIRHPNYLGEMMVYASYAWLAMHWIPWVILAWVWLGLFATNIALKEASMSRYPEWEAYKARTGLLLPRF